MSRSSTWPAEERRVLEIALRSALENGEMHLNYQPVVDAGTGALDRASRRCCAGRIPSSAMSRPAKFVPLAEEARLIAPIGEWVLRTACDEAARWDLPVRVAVNVSPEQLHNPGFVGVVAQALAPVGPAARTARARSHRKRVHARGHRARSQVLEKILDLGVRLSLDDFGTGYSSLGYLAARASRRSRSTAASSRARRKGTKEAIAIIRAVVALADSLGMATTAEGVETEDEHHMVQALGCTKVQGYYFGRPLPVDEARALADARDGAAASRPERQVLPAPQRGSLKARAAQGCSSVG